MVRLSEDSNRQFKNNLRMDSLKNILQRNVEGEEREEGNITNVEENIINKDSLVQVQKLSMLQSRYKHIEMSKGSLPSGNIRGTGIKIDPSLVLTVAHNIYSLRNFELHPCHNGEQVCFFPQNEKDVSNFQYPDSSISSPKNYPFGLPLQGLYLNEKRDFTEEIVHRISTQSGQSGAPIIKCIIVGIHKGSPKRSKTVDELSIKQLKKRSKGEFFQKETIPESQKTIKAPSKARANQDLTTHGQIFIQVPDARLESVSSGLDKDEKPKIPKIQRSISQLPSTQIFALNYIVQKAFQNDAFEVHYAHFHILFLYASAFMLASYSENERQTTYYQIFQLSSKRLMEISKLQPQQIDPNVIMNVVTNCLQYRKHRDQGEHYLSLLHQFIVTYRDEMNSFMPLYCAYFDKMIHLDQFFPAKPTLSSLLVFLKKIEGETSAEYNNSKDI